MGDDRVDLVVLGGGAAGLAAARTAAESARRVVLVSDGPPGGDCTFTGCVPSKTLIAAAAAPADFPTAVARIRSTVERIAGTETAEVLRGEGVEVHSGRGRFVGRGRIEAGDRMFTTERTVIATGTRPRIPLPLVGVDIDTTDTIWSRDTTPESLAIVGGGAVGCELAQSFARFGVRVHLIEVADHVLPGTAVAAATLVRDALIADGVRVHAGSGVTGARPASGQGVRVELASGVCVETERVLVTAGRRPDTDALDLTAAGVTLDDRGFVATDDRLRTTVASVYAAGDVTGRMPFTHAADAMGRLAARNAFSRRGRRFDPDPIPWVVFTDPEVARVGMTESAAADVGGRVAYLPLSEVDRAITEGRTDGFVELIAGPHAPTGRLGGGRVLGATIVAPRAGEMIGEVALAMRTPMFAGRLAQTTHAYPTWAVAIQQAAAQWFTTLGGRTARPAERDAR